MFEEQMMLQPNGGDPGLPAGAVNPIKPYTGGLGGLANPQGGYGGYGGLGNLMGFMLNRFQNGQGRGPQPAGVQMPMMLPNAPGYDPSRPPGGTGAGQMPFIRNRLMGQFMQQMGQPGYGIPSAAAASGVLNGMTGGGSSGGSGTGAPRLGGIFRARWM